MPRKLITASTNRNQRTQIARLDCGNGVQINGPLPMIWDTLQNFASSYQQQGTGTGGGTGADATSSGQTQTRIENRGRKKGSFNKKTLARKQPLKSMTAGAH